MESSKKLTALLLISMFLVSSANPVLDCGHCGQPQPPAKEPTLPLPKLPLPKLPVPVPELPVPKLPVPVPELPVPKLPVPVPKLPVPVPELPVPKLPVPVPELPVPKLPVPVPKLPVPVPKLPVPKLPTLPLPKLPLPKVPIPTVTPSPKGKPCPTPKSSPVKPATCPIDTLKLGACVDLLGGLVHVGLGDPAINKCCPLIAGLAELEAAICLCTTLKVKLLNLKVYAPIALQLLVTCGKTPPPGYTCSI